MPPICAAVRWDREAIGPCPHARATHIPASAENLSLWITRQLAAADAVAVELDELEEDDEPADEEPDESEEDLDSLLVPESLLVAASTLPERLSVR